MEGRKTAAHVQALEIGVYDGIKVLVRRKDDDGILVQTKLNMALEADGAGKPDTGRNDQTSAAQTGEVVDSLRERLRIEGDSVPHSAKIRKDDTAGWDGREFHTGHLKRKAGIDIIVRDRIVTGGKQDGGNGQKGKTESFHWLSARVFAAKINVFFDISVTVHGIFFNIC